MMQHEPDIEIQIWEYLDGLCGQEDILRIKELVEHDALWRQKYTELNALHQGLAMHQELEQPSMRFMRNVMDKVEAEHIVPAAKAYLNKWVIRGVAAFLLLLIGVLMINVFESADSATKGWKLRFTLPDLDLSVMSFGAVGYGLVMLNIIAALILIDALMKRKKLRANT